MQSGSRKMEDKRYQDLYKNSKRNVELGQSRPALSKEVPASLPTDRKDQYNGKNLRKK